MDQQQARLISDLADRLGVATSNLVDLYVPRVIADAVFYLIAGLVLLCLSLVPIYLSHRAMDKEHEDRGAAIVASWVFLFAAFLIGTAMLAGSVQTFVSPRAAAISEILNQLAR